MQPSMITFSFSAAHHALQHSSQVSSGHDSSSESGRPQAGRVSSTLAPSGINTHAAEKLPNSRIPCLTGLCCRYLCSCHRHCADSSQLHCYSCCLLRFKRSPGRSYSCLCRSWLCWVFNEDNERNTSVSSTQSQVGQDAHTDEATDDCRAAADNPTQRLCIEQKGHATQD